MIRERMLGLIASLSVFVPSLSAASPTEGYSNYAGMLARVESLSASPWVTVTKLAKTQGNREVVLLTIRRKDKTNRPAILILGNVVAPHLVGGEIALGMAEWIVAHADDPAVKNLLDTTTIYVMARPNPDGVERLFDKPTYEADGNARKTDDDRDFEFGEDPPDDLNGDGLITQMRVASAAGTHRVHPDDARRMIPADPAKGEVGTHRIYVEGIDQDHDEQWNEDAGLGVSFDRNFPAKFAFFGKGAGAHAVSEPETRAVADFCFDHSEIMAMLTFSPQDNLFFPPKAGGEEKIRTKTLTDDVPIHEHFAKRYQEILGAKNPPASLDVAGSPVDWGYLQWGRWSFAARGWWIPTKEEPKKEEKPSAPSPDEKKKDDRDAEGQRALAWFEEQKIDGFVPWKKIDHPDFPGQAVEVGGYRPLAILNPPSNLLPALAEKHARWVMELAQAAPRLVVMKQSIDRPAPGTLARLRVTLSNAGLLPTMSAMAKVAGSTYPVNWKWNLPAGVTLVAGTKRGQTDPIKAGGEVTIEAVVLVEKSPTEPITLSVESPAVRPVDPIRFDLSKEVGR
jgi:hypothetical protein